MAEDIKNIPAGHARQEQLRRNKDALEEKAEFLASKVQLNAFDPEKLEPENEIIQHLDMRTFEFKAEGLLPEYHYLWCWNNKRSTDEAKQRARYWYSQQGRKAPVLGYEFVKRGMPEWDANPELQHADGGLVIGDVVLMRMRRDVYEVVEKNIEFFKRARTSGILNTEGNLADLAARTGARAIAHTFQGTPQQYFASRGRKIVHTGNFEG